MAYDLHIKGGTLIDPEKLKDTPQRADVLIQGDRIEKICPGGCDEKAARVFDASGLYVSPGFIDTHVHDEEVEDPNTNTQALLRQGVTTAIAGQCGAGPLQKDILPSRAHPWLNLAYLSGHSQLRKNVGINDEYVAATPEQTQEMQKLLALELTHGSFGLSFGLEYAPNTSREEIAALCKVVPDFKDRFISIHIRYDGPKCIDAVKEAIDMARVHKVRVQISHFGSMTALGYTQQCLDLFDRARAEGVDVTMDCYPYTAFCTRAGSAVFDPGFKERWGGKGEECLEAASGKYKGQRLTPESLAEIRANEPQGLLIAHIMNEDEVRLCLRHPECAIGSDANYKKGGGHPRVAGTFPRALRWLREEGLSWPEAIRRATLLPAQMVYLPHVGRMSVGSEASFVIFDPDKLKDTATFPEPLTPPEGIRAVVLNGVVTVEDNVVKEHCGKLLFRK